MSINDVSLTSGMRSNLLSLQNTVSLLDRTQTRLATGKRVNTAIDNPVSYFAAQSLNSRASTIDSLKDSMGQAVSTLTAADKGITSLSSMIEQAKGIAQAAMTADNTQDTIKQSVTAIVDTPTAASEISLDTVVFSTSLGDTTGVDAHFAKGSTDAASVANLASAINSYDWAGDAGCTAMWKATASGTEITLTKINKTTNMNENAADVTSDKITATNATAGTVTVNTAAQSELEALQAQYNTLRAQMTALAEDSGYKGKNLLSEDNLAVKFEGATLYLTGFDASANGLKITEATTWTTNTTNIDADITKLDTASTTLRIEASKMSNNLSVITTRQTFSTNMINTLSEGSDKLTLADTNEEGANMLMLQTRQSLSTTALSLSAQAAQSVLKLFG
ncbi:MAG: hypothetical protein ABFD75_04470 [Smithella sp.]